MEDVLAAEVGDMGGAGVAVGRGVVRFHGDLRCLIRSCLGLRSAMRVLVPVASGGVAGRDDLYHLARGVDWEAWLPRGGTLAVEVAGRGGVFRHTRFAAQVVKDAVVDRVREARGERPAVDLQRPDLPLHLHLREEAASISLDAAGSPLSRRGYRQRGGPAPLNEALAAGLLLVAGYDGERPLLDPMAGSGTFATEAALIATRTPPGLGRTFAFERWRGHDPGILDAVRQEMEAGCRPAPCPIVAIDNNLRAVQAARANLRSARMDRSVRVEPGEATALEPPGQGALIVVNPPYGRRLSGEADSLAALYKSLGDRLKGVGAGCTAWILAGNRELAKHVGLRPTRRVAVFNGPIECRWLRYDLYEGSRREPREG